jgi:prepilin-type N-terminal cleavage/methylation domain-containing protein
MKKGFTIIEIMTVIAIIAILSVIVYANVNEGRKKARDAIRIHDAQTLAKSIDSYYVEHNALPVPNTITKNVSSLDTANWESFWKNTVGIDNALVSPKNGERLEGVSSGSGVFDVVTNPIAPFRKYNYYYVIAIPDYTSPVTIVYANKPGIYVPLEQTPKSICDVGEDPATGCTPYCEDEGASFSVVGPVDSNNCSDLKKGCVMRGLNTFMGGTRAFVCVLVGPNAP